MAFLIHLILHLLVMSWEYICTPFIGTVSGLVNPSLLCFSCVLDPFIYWQIIIIVNNYIYFYIFSVIEKNVRPMFLNQTLESQSLP